MTSMGEVRPSEEQESLYRRDFYGWARAQALAIRAGQLEALDADNVAEELDDLAGSIRRELQSRLEQIVAHLLKWAYQLLRRSPSWENTVHEQRMRVRDLLAENPSLKSEINQ